MTTFSCVYFLKVSQVIGFSVSFCMTFRQWELEMQFFRVCCWMKEVLERRGERENFCSYGKRETVLFLALTRADGAGGPAASSGLVADLPETVT